MTSGPDLASSPRWLRQPALSDIELRHQLEARDDGGFELTRRRFLIPEHAVDAVADAEFFFERLDVDIAGALFNGLGDHRIDETNDGRFARHVAEVFEVFLIAGGEFGRYGTFLVGSVNRVAEQDLTAQGVRHVAFEVNLSGGHTVAGEQITVHPYRDDPLRKRFQRLAEKAYTFTLSDQVPGGVYRMETVVEAPAANAGTPPLISETLTLLGAQP